MATSKPKKPKSKQPPKSQREGKPPFKGVTVRDHQYSESYDEYLEMILRLSRKTDKWVKNKDISKALKVKAPSVTNMLEKLSKAKFIEWIPRKGITLTKLGIDRATELIGYHTLVELFLHRILKMDDAHEVDTIACDFEHHFTPTLKDRVMLLLGIDEEIDSSVFGHIMEDHFPYYIHTNPVYSEVEAHSLIDSLHVQIIEKLNLSSDQQDQLSKVITQFKTESHVSQCSVDPCPLKESLN